MVLSNVPFAFCNRVLAGFCALGSVNSAVASVLRPCNVGAE